MESRSVAIAGVGNMGGAMALNLLDRGWLVHVFDIDSRKMLPLIEAGAQPAASAADLATGSGTLIVAVVDARQVAEVLWEESGFIQGLRGRHHVDRPTVLLCPTIAPEDTHRIGERLFQIDVDTVDAPMSGGPIRARDGTMSLMVSCTKSVYERHQDLLCSLSSRLFHVGERLGDGARTKLVNNILAAINLVGAAEALALARKLGLEPVRTLSVIEQSSGQSWIGSDRMARALAGDLMPRAHLGLLAKDTRLAVEMAEAAGFNGPLGAAARDTFEQACNSGLSHMDDGALYAFLSGVLPTIPS